MSQIELLLPKMGESVAEATIIKWVKKEGDKVTADEPIIEIATDKVDSEVPSPEDGVLLKCLVKEGDVVAVGQPIALIGVGASANAPAPETAAAPAPSVPKHEVVAAAAVASPLAASVVVSSTEDRFYSPLVKSIAKTEGISQTELDSIAGSGQGGRVTKGDILNYISSRGSAPAAANGSHAQTHRRTYGYEQADFASRYFIRGSRCNQHRFVARKNKEAIRTKGEDKTYFHSHIHRGIGEGHQRLPDD